VAGASTVSVFTDANGNYRFTDVRSGSYTVSAVVTPAMTGATFYPGSTNITVAKNNLTNINFTAWFSISGRVTTSAGAAMEGVQVKRTAGSSTVSVFTDAQGYYRFSDVRSGDYTNSAAQSGKTFTPANRSQTVGNISLTNINLTGSP
jgi:hypothetical protein